MKTLALITALSLCTPSVDAYAQDDSQETLLTSRAQVFTDLESYKGTTRWADATFGFNFLEPLDHTRTEQVGEYLAIWSHEDNSSISLRIDTQAFFTARDERFNGSGTAALQSTAIADLPQEAFNVNTLMPLIRANAIAGRSDYRLLDILSDAFTVEGYSEATNPTGEKPAQITYTLLRSSQSENPTMVLLGHAMIELQSGVMALFTLHLPLAADDSDAEKLYPAMCRFEAAVRSAKVPDPEIMANARLRLLNNGHDWLSSWAWEQPDDFSQPLLLRVVDGENESVQDNGYHRWTLVHITEDNIADHEWTTQRTGLALIQQRHYNTVNTDESIDVLARFLHSNNRQLPRDEIWTELTSHHRNGDLIQGYQTTAWVNTDRIRANNGNIWDEYCTQHVGSTPRDLHQYIMQRDRENPNWREQTSMELSTNIIHKDASDERRMAVVDYWTQNNPWVEANANRTVSASGLPTDHLQTGEVENKEFIAPHAPVRLSQLQTQLLPWLLPHDILQNYAFWSYDINTSSMSILMAQVTPRQNGSCRVAVRPNIGFAPIVYDFNATGNLVRITLPSGRLLVPTNRETLEYIWQNRQP